MMQLQQFVPVEGERSVISGVGPMESMVFLTPRQVRAFEKETDITLPSWMRNGVSQSVLQNYIDTELYTRAIDEVFRAEAEVADNPDLVEVGVLTAG